MNTQFKEIHENLNRGDEQRSADASITGYLYQFELTLLHCLSIDADPFGDAITEDIIVEYQVESVEDYSKFFEHDGKKHIRVAQIKHHTNKTNPSDYSEAVVFLYYDFLKYRQQNLKDTTFKCKIFYHDQSADRETKKKEVSEIIKRQLVNMRKLEAAATAKKGDEKEKELTKYTRYILEHDNERILQKFLEVADFSFSDSRANTIESIKSKLLDRYSHLNIYGGTSYKKDFLYAASLNKLICDFLERTSKMEFKPFSLQELDGYFNGLVGSPWDIMPLISGKLFELSTSNLEFVIDYPNHVQEVPKDLQSDYEEIYSMICGFIIEKFKVEQNRKAFFNSLVPDDISYNSGGVEEWEFFLTHTQQISQFIVKLGKMLYYYLKKNKHNVVNLDEWFSIRDNLWYFNFPLDVRKSALLIADLPTVGLHETHVGKLKEKFAEANVRIWYMCEVLYQANKRKHQYQQSIDLPNKDPFDIDNINRNNFDIECLLCLEMNSYHKLDCCEKVFQEGCTG